MKASDLKIGSTYKSVKFNKPVTLTAEDIYELVIKAEGANIESYIDEMLKPIELTEELLIKFGFKKRKGVYSLQILDNQYIRCSLNKNKLSLCLDEYCQIYNERTDIISLKSIKYVHQLQNLYFALTGKELTLKSKDMEDIVEALKIIKDLKENQGIIECPRCKGRLNYTRAESNGHVWGNCKTENCLNWAM